MLLYWLCFIYVSILLIISCFSYFIYFIFVNSKNPFQSFLFQNDRWFVLCLLTPYLSIFYVFYEKNLMLLNLINRYVTSTSQKLKKKKHKDIVEPCRFLILANYSFNDRVHNRCCVYITGGINIYFHGCQSIGPCVCCVCVCVCEIKSEY